MSNAALMLAGLRWSEDCAIVNHFGEHVWLKACFNEAGQRIGITDCCFVEAPCDWHAAFGTAVTRPMAAAP